MAKTGFIPNVSKVEITPRQKAMLVFAPEVCTDSADIDAITAFFGQSNRMASLTAMQPNNEFYRRVAKAKTGSAT